MVTVVAVTTVANINRRNNKQQHMVDYPNLVSVVR